MKEYRVGCLYNHDYTNTAYPVTTKKSPARFVSHCIRSYAEDIRISYRHMKATSDTLDYSMVPNYMIHIGETIIDMSWSERKGRVFVLVSRVKGYNNFTGKKEYVFNEFYI